MEKISRRGTVRWFSDKDEQAVFDAAMKEWIERDLSSFVNFGLCNQGTETEYADFCFSRGHLGARSSRR
jgi:hypothetical protein